MTDIDSIPPRPEEDLAPAEDYRLFQQGANPFAFQLNTPGGRTLHLHYNHGHVTGFPHVHPVDAAARLEITRQIEQIFA